MLEGKGSLAARANRSLLKNKIVNKILESKNFGEQVKKYARQYAQHKEKIMRILAEKWGD